MGRFHRRALFHTAGFERVREIFRPRDIIEINVFWFRTVLLFTFPHLTELIP